MKQFYHVMKISPILGKKLWDPTSLGIRGQLHQNSPECIYGLKAGVIYGITRNYYET